MSDWSGPAVLDALRTQLKARAGLTGCEVTTASLISNTPPKCISFWGLDGDQDWAGLGKRSRDDKFEILGDIFYVHLGSDEASIKTSRDGAAALLKELADQLRTDPTVNDTVWQAQLSHVSLAQGASDQGRWAQILFRIAVNKRI